MQVQRDQLSCDEGNVIHDGRYYANILDTIKLNKINQIKLQDFFNIEL